MLTLTYVALAVAGCGYVAVALVLGQAFDADDGGAGDGAFHFPLFSPLTLATFCGAIGALGLVATFALHLPDSVGVGVALLGAAVFTYVVTYGAWRVLVSSTGTQTVREHDLVGATAEVLTPIPQDGLGEVAAMVRGQRHTAPARTADGSPVSRGLIVSVVRVAGSTLIVEAEAAPVRKA
jgi:membrane protein implicated in regulation of membrane protease activity